MSKKRNTFIINIIILFVACSTADGLSLLRVTCDDSSQGAEIYINGVHKGECPRDIGLKAGGIKFRAVLKVDADHERVFEKNIKLYDRSPERVEVQLSSSKLTAKAKKVKASESLAKAKAGDIKEMKNISKYYKEGMGVTQSSKKAEFWRNKATESIAQNKRKKEEKIATEVLIKAEAGDILAMDKISKLYLVGTGVRQDVSASQKWKDKASSARALEKHRAEVKTATETLIFAQAGDISSMKKIAGFYQAGTGVEQSGAKSQEWYTKAEAATHKKDEQIKKEEKRKELSELSFFGQTKALTKEIQGSNDSPSPLIMTVAITPYIAVAISDTVQAPFVTTQKMKLKDELNTRASRFINPDSMITKAYNKKLGIENIQNQKLVSAR